MILTHGCLLSRLNCLVLVLVLGTICQPAALFAQPETAEAEKHFETHIRPLLHKRCVECHGPARQQADIRLDRRAFVLAEGGDLVVPGKPDESRLIQVIRYDGNDTQMPPAARMPADEIERLTEWVRQGAFWPPESEPAPEGGIARTGSGEIDFVASARQHWAYSPVTEPEVPVVEGNWARDPIDRFIQARLNEAGLTPSPEAPRHVLIRRAYLDLWGIPPTYEEVQAFVNDPDPNAWQHLVDRLLASPRYGQRWGRHWLDIARYADTKGYVFTENPNYPFSYTYRDYVVDAFNNDVPYDEFIRQQLAADHLGYESNDPRLAALGFLTIGPRFLNRTPDIIDDRIDVVTRGLMGMTLACARCHDHKYDPLPTADYYSLYGVFSSSEEPATLPEIGEREMTPQLEAFLAELEKRRQAVEEYKNTARTDLLRQARENVDDYLLAVARRTGKIPEDQSVEFRSGSPRDKLITYWDRFVKRRLQQNDPVFLPWKRFAALEPGQFSEKAPQVLADLIAADLAAGDGPSPVNALVLSQLEAQPPQSLLQVARLYGSLLKETDAQWQTAISGDNPPETLDDPAAEQLRRILYSPGSITQPESEPDLFERDQRNEIRKRERKVEEWLVESPDAPPRAMVLVDRERMQEPVIFERGNPGRRGDRVPRQTPRILTGGESRPYQQGSGRLELAEDIVSPENPLTSRVIVNRVWDWHFGRGFVSTLSDFGLRSDPPSHPELLDWLASQLMHADGWSLKALHRRIMLSATYRQSSADRPDARQVDPENHLFWRMNRRRLEFEPLRDSLLFVANQLDEQLGGRPFDLGSGTPRRSLYAKIDRNNFSSLLRTFDYPSPDATSPGRPQTTVPQQALFLMNSPFLAQLTDKTLAQLSDEVAAIAEEPDRFIQASYRRILARDPDAIELGLAQSFLQAHPDRPGDLIQALMLTNEFLFVD